MKFSTKIIRSGQDPDPHTGSIVPPITMTATYAQSAPKQHKGYDYTRGFNPNFSYLEKALADLEEGKHATVFASGMASITALATTLSAGDKVMASDDVYGGTYRVFKDIFQKMGIDFELVDMRDMKVVDRLLSQKPKMIIIETPSNPLIKIVDVAGVAKIAKKHDVLSVVDATLATPYLMKPLELGADVVMHSTSKYIAGHSDLIGGAIITNHDWLKEKMDFARVSMGLNPSPFDAWLIMRGLKTLPLRMDKHEENTLKVAKFLESHPLVKKLNYPGLESSPFHELAKKQMSGFGGMLSVEFDLSLEESIKLMSSFEVFTLAEHLGGIQSLVTHPASMTHETIPKEEREARGLMDGLVRFSVGIEDADDLIDDLEKQLSKFK